MADALFTPYSRREERCIPERYVRKEQRRRQKKSFSPEGISSLVNFFLSFFAYVPQRVHHAHCSSELAQIKTFHCHRIYKSEH